MTRPLSELIGDIRSQMVKSRGQLSDISSGFTGWHDRVESAQGLLTCGISYLYYIQQEMLEHEKQMSERERGRM